MGWFSSKVMKIARTSCVFLLAAGLAFATSRAHAQVAANYAEIQNQFLLLGVGNVVATDGAIFLQTSPGNPSNPIAGTAVNLLFGLTVETTNNATISEGTVVYVRVDGGKSAGGNDYIFGRQTEGVWLTPPTAAANHIGARWQTASQVVNGVTIDPRIEVDLTASFVHDQARFQFSIKNNSPGQTHTVGLAFLQDIVVGKQDAELGGAIRLPNGPYLRRETLLQGGQVPAFWDVFALGPIAQLTPPNIPGGPSLRGILAPLNAGQTEPIRPTRFGYGDLAKLSGFGNPVVNPIFVGRDFDFIWNFQPNPNLDLSGQSGVVIDNAVIDYWDGQAVAAGQTVTDITYIGQSTATPDLSPPMTLNVSAPLALGVTTSKDANGNPIASVVTPSTFTISAFVQNVTDLTNIGGVPINITDTLFLDLPKGLVLAPGETNPKTLLNVAPGQESAATWQVKAVTNRGSFDPTVAYTINDLVMSSGVTYVALGPSTGTAPPNPAFWTPLTFSPNGQLAYTVTSSPNIGNGKSVQRTIQIPVPAVFQLPGTGSSQGLYRMVSFPMIFGNATPSSILGLNADQPAPDFDLVRWNGTLGHYEPVNTLIPGLSYWLRSRLTADKTIVIDTLKFPPLDNQVQPTSTLYKISYPRGWNQIGSPNIYTARFSEVQVFDQATLGIVDTTTAADQLHQWILPAVYFFDTSDTNPQNWKYVLEDNFGFDMLPYQGYWIFVKRDGLQFIYPGVDIPGASVTRAALVGVGLGSTRSRATSTDWTLQIKAKGIVSMDFTTTIGVNTKAIDTLDYFKVIKPPVQENQLVLDIVHNDWTQGGRYAKDLRSASPVRKTWNMVLTSTRPNEAVAFTWPNLGVSVPKSYRLTLIDTDSNSRYDMRSTSSVVLTTNSSKTRNVQVVAEPTRGSGPAVITSFDVTTAGSRASGAPSSVAINYTLSQQAETHIVIRTGTGRVLRTLIGQPVSGSSGSSGRAIFDLRDSQGRTISTGLYQAELTAQAVDGQVTRQVRPFILGR
jgi:hypothetical protein